MAWVFDKKYNSLPKQVDINTKDIEDLKQRQFTGYNVMGEWEENEEYLELDLVFYNNNSYVCILKVSGSVVPPDEDIEHFERLTDVPSHKDYAKKSESNTFTNDQFIEIGDNVIGLTDHIDVGNGTDDVVVTHDKVIFSRGDEEEVAELGYHTTSFLRNEYDKTLNLLNILDKSSQTIQDVTFSISSGILTDTASISTNVIIDIQSITIPAGTYIAKGYGNENASNYLYIDTYNTLGYNINFRETPQTITISNTITATLKLRVNNTTINNAQLKPMLVKGTTAPSTFIAYNGNIVHKKDLEPVLLWKNGSPNSNFASQAVTIGDTSNFRYLEIYYKWQALTTRVPQMVKIINNEGNVGYLPFIDEGRFGSRGFTKSGTSITFGDAYIGSSGQNAYIIPYAIYGIK